MSPASAGSVKISRVTGSVSTPTPVQTMVEGTATASGRGLTILTAITVMTRNLHQVNTLMTGIKGKIPCEGGIAIFPTAFLLS